MHWPHFGKSSSTFKFHSLSLQNEPPILMPSCISTRLSTGQYEDALSFGYGIEKEDNGIRSSTINFSFQIRYPTGNIPLGQSREEIIFAHA
ncbi:hypothetical protein CEXT_238351 [Caerostris extrusa]|uniref:Uncharacterized protein n=1 Tax=Caerostris extrusa TaxID=172846 RepID=A0AAV4T2K7_CAEEX|nr:hypothetical protein CEXT_238351 [Caerostris extrusa]